MEECSSVCPYPGCSKSYTSKFNLKRHMNAMHSADGRFECHLCHKLLSSRQNLNEHIFTHSGEMPYQCDEPGCQLRFRQGSQLSSHKRIHRTLRSLNRREDFQPLSVRNKQLVRILELNPHALDQREETVLQVCPEVPQELPLITSPQVTLLPSFLSLQ